jgi:outer membrane protein assembly factor BamB
MRRATTFILTMLASAGCATGAAVQEKPAEPSITVAWQKEIEITGAAHLTIGRRAVILAGAESGLAAYALDDGRQLWRNEKTSIVQPVSTAGLVIIATSDAVQALNEENGDPAWNAAMPGSATPPTLHATDSLVVVTRGTEVRAWRTGGSPAWQKTLPALPTTGFVTANDALLVGLQTPAIVALSPTTGDILWSAEIPAPATALTIAGNLIFAPGVDGRLNAYQLDQGLKRKWRYRAVPAIGEAVVDDRRAYFTLIDNTVRALDREGGAQRGSYPLSSRPVGGGILVGTSLFVPLTDGDVARVNVAPGVKPDPAKPAAKAAVRLSAAVLSEDRVYAIVTPETGATSLTAWRIAR